MNENYDSNEKQEPQQSPGADDPGYPAEAQQNQPAQNVPPEMQGPTAPNTWRAPTYYSAPESSYQPPHYNGWQRPEPRQDASGQGPQQQIPPQSQQLPPQSQQLPPQAQQPPVPPRKEPYQWNFSEYEQAQSAKPKKKRKGLMVFSIVMAAVVMVSLVSVGSISLYSAFVEGRSGFSEPSSIPEQPQPDPNLPSLNLQDKPQDQNTVAPGGKMSTEQIVEKVEPSIVAITTYVNYQNYQAEGMGSGIIMREDGYIVTNAHVVSGAVGITVRLFDGTEYEGRVIGADSKTDLAVVKVDAENLTAATFGNSDQVKVGEKVIAIGNPQSLAFAGSVTQGIVSGLNRTLTATDSTQSQKYTYESLIQTDAAINPGNSGGALVNEYGQIIGINSAGFSGGTYQGMGFAIPSSTAKPVINDLIQYGRVTGRVLLGITANEVDEVLARLNNVPKGLFVRSTLEGSDISKKGVVPGDIITKVDGQEIESSADLSKITKDKKPGDTVDLEIYRPGRTPNEKGRFFNITVKLMEETGDETVSSPNWNNGGNGGNGNSGYGWGSSGGNDDYSDMEDFFDDLFG